MFTMRLILFVCFMFSLISTNSFAQQSSAAETVVSEDSFETQCRNVATKLMKSEAALELCPTANIETAACMLDGYMANMESADIIKACRNVGQAIKAH